jgi:hypothetical protein
MEQFEKFRDDVPLPRSSRTEVNLWRSRSCRNEGFSVSTREELTRTVRMVFEKGANALIQKSSRGRIR